MNKALEVLANLQKEHYHPFDVFFILYDALVVLTLGFEAPMFVEEKKNIMEVPLENLERLEKIIRESIV